MTLANTHFSPTCVTASQEAVLEPCGGTASREAVAHCPPPQPLLPNRRPLGRAATLVEPVPKRENRVPKHQPRTGVTHDRPGLLFQRRLVAMDRTLAAGGLAAAVRTTVQPAEGVVEKLATFVTKLLPRAVMAAAVDSDHRAHGSFPAGDSWRIGGIGRHGGGKGVRRIGGDSEPPGLPRCRVGAGTSPAARTETDNVTSNRALQAGY